MKLCECGCGQAVTTAARFRAGHNRRLVGRKGYATTGTGDDVVYVHRRRAELALGHNLPSKAEVHHWDGSKRPDAPLVICPNHAYHELLHLRARIRADGADPNTQRRCKYCKTYKPIDAFSVSSKRVSGVHGGCKSCFTVRASQYWHQVRYPRICADRLHSADYVAQDRRT